MEYRAFIRSSHALIRVCLLLFLYCNQYKALV